MLPKPENIDQKAIRETLLSELFDLEQERQVFNKEKKKGWLGFSGGALFVVAGVFLFQLLPLLAVVFFILGAILFIVMVFDQLSRQQDFELELRRKLFPELVPTLFPGFQYLPFSKFELNAQNWPETAAEETIKSQNVKHQITGKVADLLVNLYELELIKETQDSLGQYYHSKIFWGIYMEFSELPDTFDRSVLNSDLMHKRKKVLANYWGGSVKIHLLDSGQLVILIHTDKTLFSLPSNSSQLLYKEFDFSYLYEPLYHCLHYVEVLAEELAKED